MNWWPEIELVHPLSEWVYGYSWSNKLSGWELWAFNKDKLEYRTLIVVDTFKGYDKVQDQKMHMNALRDKLLKLQARIDA
jgi:hypothetical protein